MSSIEHKKISDLKPDNSNANKGTERGLRALDDSLASVGLGRSVVTDKHGNIIAGNKTTERAVDSGFEDAIIVRTNGEQLVVVQRDDLDLYDSDPNNKARRLAYLDNRVAELDLSWDADQLLADINAGADIVNEIFHEDELADLLKDLEIQSEQVSPPEAQIDRAQELQDKWQVERGQVWQVGRHRVMCGDSTNAEDMTMLMGGELAQICFTSPPYAEQRKQQYGGIPTDEYLAWFTGVQSVVKNSLKANGSFFVNIKAHTEDGERVTYTYALVLDMVKIHQWKFIDELYWERQGFPGKFHNRFKNAVEPVYHFALSVDIPFSPENVEKDYSDKSTGNPHQQLSMSNSGFKGGSFKNSGSGALSSNLIYAPTGQTATQTGKYHPAVFPETLVAFFISAFATNDDICLDIFNGSGTTLVACEQTRRIGYGMEIDPAYVSVTLERLTQLGLEATLA